MKPEKVVRIAWLVAFILTVFFLASFLFEERWVVENAHAYELWAIDDIIEELILCESSGDPYAINRDDGGRDSLGLLQYQQRTWDWFSGKYNFQGYIWNPEDQIKLTHIVLSDDISNLKHWRACSRKIRENLGTL